MSVKELFGLLAASEAKNGVKPEFKCCPFCGSNDVEKALLPHPGGFFVECQSCAASTDERPLLADAVELWNRRAQPAEEVQVEAKSVTVHKRIDALCTAANTPDGDYFDASTNLMLAVRELLVTLGHPHAFDIDAARARGES